jgi:hypothetical protein
MSPEEKKRYLRLIYAKTFRLLGIGLVISALVGGLYGSAMYAVWAMCAVGSLMVLWGWFSYLKLDGMRLFGFRAENRKTRVPYILRRFKEKRPHRPAFQKDSADFDDDLTSATAVDEEAFSERASAMARVWARVAAGVLLFLVSFFI